MKNIFTFSVAILLITAAFGQSPENFKYQTIVRDLHGSLIVNQTIAIKFSILKDSINGRAVCVETFTPTTNTFGLVNLEIGSKNPTDFSTIDWSSGPYFMKMELDPAGGTSFSTLGISQLLSVPYALHAKTAERIVTGSGIQSFNYPEGINGTFIHFELSPTHLSYTVPNGFNLYITSGDGCYPKVNNVMYGLDGSGPIFPENTTLNYVTSGWGACSPTGYTGLLIKKTNKIIPVYFKLDDMGSTYTVPAGKKLVLKSGTGQGSPICINSIPYKNFYGDVWLFESNVTLSNCNASSNTPDGFGYTGYLIDN